MNVGVNEFMRKYMNVILCSYRNKKLVRERIRDIVKIGTEHFFSNV